HGLVAHRQQDRQDNAIAHGEKRPTSDKAATVGTLARLSKAKAAGAIDDNPVPLRYKQRRDEPSRWTNAAQETWSTCCAGIAVL
ncbi:MAG: hypothetical protein ACR2K5_08630, partial [Pseudolabrys sp.]